MRILHVTLSFERGGRRRAIASLSEQLRSAGIGSDLCCLNKLGCPPAETEGHFDRVTALERRSLFDPRALLKLTRHCDEHGIDLIHTHDAASQFSGVLIRHWRPHLPVLMTFHRSLSIESTRWSDRLRNSYAGVWSSAVVVASHERLRHYLHENYVTSTKVIRIPLGIDLTRFYPDPAEGARLRAQLGLSREAIVLGGVGHFGKEKGLDVVLNAFGLLTRQPLPSPVVLLILGDGTPSQRAAYRKLAERAAPGSVHFLGFVPQVERWFRALDVFVHAPRLESFGLVLPEAMASRLPVVASRVGGIPDIVREGETGLLVPPEAPDQLAEALGRLICARDLRERMADRARQIVMLEYGAELCARRHVRLYEDVLAGRKARGVDQMENHCHAVR